MTKCAVVSCREAVAPGSETLCRAHNRQWVGRFARACNLPCGIATAFADWLRLADAELRNGNQAVVAGSFDASGGFTGVVVDASKEAK